MKEIFGDLWAQDGVICITTNGFVKKSGEAVMGRGCALEAKKKLPDFPFELGNRINTLGNNVFIFPVAPMQRTFSKSFVGQKTIVTFPVKHKWWEKADLSLIEKSCQQLRTAADQNNWKKVILPRPGCGNGGLKWEDVKPVLETYLDDRFEIISK